MFQWDKTITSIDVPACKVVHLFRSMRELQLALPGVSAQQASAFLCQYHLDGGVATVAVFHMHKSEALAFYFSEPRVAPEQNTDSMLDQCLNFVESMGFLMTDQDIHLLDVADQEMLWASLPIKTGLSAEQTLPSIVAAAKKTEGKPVAEIEAIKVDDAALEKTKESAANVASGQAVKEMEPVVQPEMAAPEVESKPEATENVDDLLAAVEAMRAKRPGLRARKSPPSAEEMGRRRLQLRETIGRILASL